MSACPHPEKQAHRSRKAAEKALASLDGAKGTDLTLRPYRCGDHWHLGHRAKAKTLEQKIRGLGSGRVMGRRRS